MHSTTKSLSKKMSTRKCETTVHMKAFLTAHDRRIDPALPDGNCLFRALSKQMTGDPSKHAELRSILTTFIQINPHLFGSGWTITDCTLQEHLEKVTKVGQYGSHAEIKAAASLCQTPIYVATDSLAVGKCMWTVFSPFPNERLNKCDAARKFISQPKLWYEIAYTSGSHYDGIVPISENCSPSPPTLPRNELPQQPITISN